MLRYVLKRFIQMVPLLLIISFVAFGIIRIAEVFAGADPLTELKMNPATTDETIKREEVRLGIERKHEERITLTSGTYPLTAIGSKTVTDNSVTVHYFQEELQDGELKMVQGTKLEFIRPKLNLVHNQQVREDPTQIQLNPGQFTYAEKVFYFHPEDQGKQLLLEYGTPNSFLVRYTGWLKNFIKGDMGQSYAYKTDVSELILSRLGSTAVLGFATLVFTWLIALPLGIYLAVRQYSFIDQLFSSISYFFMGFPDFFLAIIFLLLAAYTGWFPIGGMTSAGYAEMSAVGKVMNIGHHLILPTLTLSLISIASLQRRMRANMLDILGEEYIKTARAKGLSEKKVVYKHAVRNAINPIVTLLGFEIAGLISGAAFVEIIFNWPGLGNMMLQAVLGADLNLVMAGLVISSFMLLLGNLLADLLLALIDPRIKLEA